MTTSTRVKRADVEKRAQLVSYALRDELRVVVVDDGIGYDLVLADAHGFVRKLASELTPRRAYDFLGAMIETLTIVGRDVGE
jgi:hypothetical protein